MCKKFYRFLFLILSFVLFVSGCVTSPSQSKSQSQSFIVENSLPPNKLAYYYDSFDKIREDIWEKGGISPFPQLKNAKFADIDIENGRLRIVTKTLCFSKNGLGSNYVLIGDFDIQIDCQIDFVPLDLLMDQKLHLAVKGDRTRKAALIGLYKTPRSGGVKMNTLYSDTGEFLFDRVISFGNFNGTLRIVRIGNQITTLYKIEEESDFKVLASFRGMTGDVKLEFSLSNFMGHRKNFIQAGMPITAYFDNFKINAAQGIKEEEI